VTIPSDRNCTSLKQFPEGLARFTSLKIDGAVVCLSLAVNMAKFRIGNLFQGDLGELFSYTSPDNTIGNLFQGELGELFSYTTPDNTIFLHIIFLARFTSLKIDGAVVCLSLAVNMARFRNFVITIIMLNLSVFFLLRP
jgi:hypothetical protein